MSSRDCCSNSVAVANKVIYSQEMPIKVLLFASARDAAGLEAPEYEIDASQISDIFGTALVSVEDLVRYLTRRHPPLDQIIPMCMITVNLEVVEDFAGTLVKDGDEVGVIPPVSGG